MHANETIRAGLVCLVSPWPMTPDRQVELFGYARAELATPGDLVNHALEIVEDESGEVIIYRYEIPTSGDHIRAC